MELSLLLVLAVVALCAGLIQTTLGFGFGIVFLALAGLCLDPKAVSIIALFVSVMLNIKLLIGLHCHIQWRQIIPVCLAVVIATPFGVMFLQQASSAWFSLLLGLLLGWAAMQQLWPRFRLKSSVDLKLGLPMGILSGLFGGAYNTGGPPLVVYAQSQIVGRLAQVACLQLLLLSGSLMRLQELWRHDLLPSGILIPVAIAASCCFVGSSLGLRLSHRISEAKFQKAMAVFLMLLAVFYISKWIFE